MRPLEKLTKKEDLFCIAVADGNSQYNAYMMAFEPKSDNRNSVDVMASRLARQPKIQNRIKELKNRKDGVIVYSDITDENYIYSLIKERITYCKDNNNDNAISKYIEILNKMTGRYVNITKDISDTNTLSDISTEKLQAILDMKIEDMDNITPGIEN